ncbi:MAG TPA: helix-turn-helix transcriptional regulator [Anaerolineaceae bacterium]|nr:helix-turn-helix transcriptional regulator [Anaerolineaceae bacterium]HPN53925.1 helix-turn-helix transcriptional regulator [Anaerolineaceae bacterium]
MGVNPLAVSIRAKKLGVLIFDARRSSRRSVEECAQAIGVTPEVFRAYENGSSAPSLPEIETLAFYLDVPIDHFWGSRSLSENTPENRISQLERLAQLRRRIVGATLRQARTAANLSPKEIHERTGISEDKLRSYELGEQPIPLPELELLISATGSHLDTFLDQRGPVGQWYQEQRATQKFLELPDDLRDFVCQPVNQPYLKLANQLSKLSVEKLRAVAESLLEITY